jgi:hypothetical protein
MCTTSAWDVRGMLLRQQVTHAWGAHFWRVCRACVAHSCFTIFKSTKLDRKYRHYGEILNSPQPWSCILQWRFNRKSIISRSLSLFDYGHYTRFSHFPLRFEVLVKIKCARYEVRIFSANCLIWTQLYILEPAGIGDHVVRGVIFIGRMKIWYLSPKVLIWASRGPPKNIYITLNHERKTPTIISKKNMVRFQYSALWPGNARLRRHHPRVPHLLTAVRMSVICRLSRTRDSDIRSRRLRLVTTEFNMWNDIDLGPNFNLTPVNLNFPLDWSFWFHAVVALKDHETSKKQHVC